MLFTRFPAVCAMILAVLAASLIGAEPPKKTDSAKDAARPAKEKDPSKPRYTKCDDPKIIEYAESMYLNGK
jgi:hypothetical protein